MLKISSPMTIIKLFLIVINTEDLYRTLRLLKTEGFIGSEIVINLTNTVYDFNSDQASTTNNDYFERYRGDFLTNTYEAYKVIIDAEMDYDHRYLVYAGFIPITIEGNGAEIKINDNQGSNAFHFTHIGINARLTLNNLHISNFNTVFVDAHGTLNCNDCIISNANYGRKEGAVLTTFAGTSIFNNCDIFENGAGKGVNFAYASHGSSIEINNGNHDASYY